MADELTKLVISREPREVRRKTEMYALLRDGLLANAALNWRTPEEIAASGWKGKVCIRARVRGIGRGSVRYNVPIDKLEEAIAEFERVGTPRAELNFNQAMPDEHLLIQGEVLRDCEFLQLTYTRIQKPMNLALREEMLYACGVVATGLLRGYMWPASFEDLQDLLDFFSGGTNPTTSVIEFSTYAVQVGCVSGRNTVFWEVRDY